MHVEHHPLIKDFPQFRDELQRLHREDEHFSRQSAEYEALDKRICRIEEGTELLDAAALGQLKQSRVQLKDDLARQLKQASGQCCGGCCGA